MFSPNPSPSKARSAASTCLVVPASAMAAEGTVGHVVNAQASAQALQKAALQYVAVGMSPRAFGTVRRRFATILHGTNLAAAPIRRRGRGRKERLPLRGRDGSREARVASVSVPGSRTRGGFPPPSGRSEASTGEEPRATSSIRSSRLEPSLHALPYQSPSPLPTVSSSPGQAGTTRCLFQREDEP